MRVSYKLWILGAAALLLVGLFLLLDAGGNWDYVLPRRGRKLLAVLLTAGAIGLSTVLFQTVTNNRILTPGIIGLDSLYLLLQTFIVFGFGSTTLTMMNKNLHFLLSSGLMIIFSLVLYRLLFYKEGRHLYFVLLAGMIFGTFFQSISSFMQMLIDPNEFMVVQDKMFASLNNVQSDLLLLSSVIMLVAVLYTLRFTKYLDVLSLGKEFAVNLGVDYAYVVKRLFLIVTVLVSVATALVGPITFLGLLAVNVAYPYVRTYRHGAIITASILFGIIALIGGLLLVERVFAFRTTVSVMMNFIGGVYFIYLLLKENKS